MLINIEGRLAYVGTPQPMPNRENRKVQKIVIEQKYEDRRMKTDYFAIFLYGDDIPEFWENYDQNNKPFKVKVTGKLSGRFDQETNRDHIMIRYRSVRWIYH